MLRVGKACALRQESARFRSGIDNLRKILPPPMESSVTEEYDPVTNSCLPTTDLESLLNLVSKTTRQYGGCVPKKGGDGTGSQPMGKIMGMMPVNDPFIIYSGTNQDTICSIFTGSRRWDVGVDCKAFVNNSYPICARELYGRYLQPAMFSYWMGDTGARMKVDVDGQSLTLMLGCNRVHTPCDIVHIPFEIKS